jgi:outer membrane protein assembly factor BamB
MRLSLAILALAWPLAAQSPMFRGNPAHTGVYAAPSTLLKGEIAWSFDVMSWELYQALENMDGSYVMPTTPAVVDGRIYVCAGPYFTVLNESGQLVYRVKLGGRSLASPAVVDGVAYLPTEEGKLYALDITNGTTLWTCPIGGPTFLKQVDPWDVYHSSPVVVDDTVYVGGADGCIYALSTKKGKQRWRFQTGHVVRATPAVAEGRVFCGSFDGKVYALDAASGRRLWEVDTRVKGMPWNAVQGSCAVEKGVVYVGSRSGFLIALEAATGKLRWQESHEGSWVPSSPAVQNGVAYVGQSDGNRITAVDARGQRLWTYQARNETFASPALAGEVLYAAGNDNYNLKGKGSLAALDSKTGKALWVLELPGSVWSSPVVAQDRVYVCDANGKLYAVK